MNNTPISLLPVVSKICERETLQILALDHISQAIENKCVTAVMLLDLSEAFNSICHDTLLKKLETLGTGRSAINWFRSHLTDSYQFVWMRECRSKLKRITHGVPQGSISGLLLFNLYRNEISNTYSM